MEISLTWIFCVCRTKWMPLKRKYCRGLWYKQYELRVWIWHKIVKKRGGAKKTQVFGGYPQMSQQRQWRAFEVAFRNPPFFCRRYESVKWIWNTKQINERFQRSRFSKQNEPDCGLGKCSEGNDGWSVEWNRTESYLEGLRYCWGHMFIGLTLRFVRCQGTQKKWHLPLERIAHLQSELCVINLWDKM